MSAASVAVVVNLVNATKKRQAWCLGQKNASFPYCSWHAWLPVMGVKEVIHVKMVWPVDA